ncbi:unnamed protein product [Vitrella brassicaformis CCMP3155]|uniref:Uncharacterized protein n=2 Tax=Vitrella brassicaformis TaxID=1169539 RepID=A0A0G4EDC3_VITBC|nr:unnamed protein product [Vitrella brassicaformis CCMP3155]|mmetsp:Transcript_4811/g.11160  ORF Transcript_4811/g.11160 Transcript_4811/m.11160 type:complete len:459 (+) Transcript_4811:126-1502(+)|eukprot:CEL93358.1 unnamed protein product [Vitrella brassicaformis CCMP3155]
MARPSAAAGRAGGDAGAPKKDKWSKRAKEEQDEKWRKTRNLVIGLGMLGLLSGGLFQVVYTIWDAIYGGFHHIPLDNSNKLKDVFFSGEPWLVHCTYPDSTTPMVHPVLQNARTKLSTEGFRLGTMDCGSPMASKHNKSVVDRFHLPKTAVGFVVANGDKPKPLTHQSLTDAKKLTEYAKKAAEPKVVQIVSVHEFPAHCTERRRCVVLGQRGGVAKKMRQEILPPLMHDKKVRGLKLVSVDTAKFQVKLDEKILSTRKKLPKDKDGKASDSRGLTAMCLHRSDEPSGQADQDEESGKAKGGKGKKKPAGTFYGSFHNGEVTDDNPGGLGKFIRACGTVALGAGSGALVKLDHPPKISLRIRPTPQTAQQQQRQPPPERPPPSSSQQQKQQEDLDDVDWASYGLGDEWREDGGDDEGEGVPRRAAGPEELEFVDEDDYVEAGGDAEGDEDDEGEVVWV